MSDTVQIALITAISVFAGLLLKEFSDWRRARAIAARLETKVEQVHGLVNNDRGMLLRALALALRRIAVFSGEQADLAAADEAERMSHAHDLQQADADARAKA